MKKELKICRVQFRLTLRDYDKIKRKSIRSNLTLSQYALRRCLATHKTNISVSPSETDKKSLLSLLNDFKEDGRVLKKLLTTERELASNAAVLKVAAHLEENLIRLDKIVTILQS